jgi:ketosteroid isomerase-like protein
MRKGIAVSAEANIKTIQLIYEAFGRGDVAGIVAHVTDDVDWASEASTTGAPWYGEHHGPDGVGSFFTEFGTAMEVEEFAPVTFAATDTEVLTVVRFVAKSRATGRKSDQHLHHYFSFREGKVAYYRGSEDTAQTEAALKT